MRNEIGPSKHPGRSNGEPPATTSITNGTMKTKSKAERRQKKLANAARKAIPVLPANVSFPVIGIGASAGGLEALEHFLSRVPKNSGLAFVIVQHLDPTRKGIMPELLQRATGMKVIQVKDRTLVHPNS